MKRIAIFCDGTWNRHDAVNPTNVVRMAQAVKHTADDGRKQQVFYVLGVGAGRGSNGVARTLDRLAGGVLGWGLIENIEDAYRALVFCYEPGDEIFIFGFSRGAYTARSLAGLLRSCGIPPRENVGRIAEAIQRYRSRSKDTKPDDPASFAWRRDFAPFTATSDAEWNWRQKTKPGLCVNLTIKYLGVWDTVGALGVPGYWAAAPLFNKKHQFHDADLSRTVLSARHAVAIDERRKTFAPAMWSDKLDRMNRRALGLDEGTSLPPSSRADWPYRQEWFPGDHGSVGGGGDRQGLSSYSFEWIVEGAARADLCMDRSKLDKVREVRNIRELLVNQSQVGLSTKLMRLNAKDRDGPTRVEDVSQTTLDRVACDPTYLPKTLDTVMPKLQARITQDDLLPSG